MSVILSTKQEFRAVFAAGAEEPVERTVWAYQRDFGALARVHGVNYAETMSPVDQMWFVVWHAGNKAMLGGWPATFDEFVEVCLEVMPVAEAEPVVPTQPAPGAG